jgi:hypothetical protein
MKTSVMVLAFLIGSLGFSMDQATCYKKLSAAFLYNKQDLSYKSEGYYACGEENKKQFDEYITKGFNAKSSLAASYYSFRLGKFRKSRTLDQDLTNACKFLTSEEINGRSEADIYDEVMSCYVNSARWAYPHQLGLRNVIGEL